MEKVSDMPEVTDFVPELVCLGIDVAICGVISQSWIFVHITLYTTRLCTRLWEAPVLYWDNSLPPQSYHWMSTLWPGFISALPPNKVFFRDSGSVWDFFCVTFVPSIFHRFQFGESPCSGPIFRPHLCSTSLCCSQRRSWLPGCWAAWSLFD